MVELIEAKEITIQAERKNLDLLIDFIHENPEIMRCSKKVRFQIDMAAEELFINISKYAYTPGVGDVTVRMETLRQPDRVSITFTDSGVPYDPLSRLDPDLSLSIEDRPIGGLGIYLVKEKMDDVYYEYKDGQNVLTIVKNME